MEKIKKKNSESIYGIIEQTLKTKEKNYKSVCKWFEENYDSNSCEHDIREWEDKGKELYSQIILLKQLLLKTKQFTD